MDSDRPVRIPLHIILSELFTDFTRNPAHDWIVTRVVIDISAEDFDPQRSFLECHLVMGNRMVDNIAEQCNAMVAALEERMADNEVHLLDDSRALRGTPAMNRYITM